MRTSHITFVKVRRRARNSDKAGPHRGTGHSTGRHRNRVNISSNLSRFNQLGLNRRRVCNSRRRHGHGRQTGARPKGHSFFRKVHSVLQDRHQGAHAWVNGRVLIPTERYTHKDKGNDLLCRKYRVSRLLISPDPTDTNSHAVVTVRYNGGGRRLCFIRYRIQDKATVVTVVPAYSCQVPIFRTKRNFQDSTAVNRTVVIYYNRVFRRHFRVVIKRNILITFR